MTAVNRYRGTVYNDLNHYCSYQRKLRVAKASGNYVKDMEDFAEKKNGGRHVPNTNNAMAG